MGTVKENHAETIREMLTWMEFGLDWLVEELGTREI